MLQQPVLQRWPRPPGSCRLQALSRDFLGGSRLAFAGFDLAFGVAASASFRPAACGGGGEGTLAVGLLLRAFSACLRHRQALELLPVTGHLQQRRHRVGRLGRRRASTAPARSRSGSATAAPWGGRARFPDGSSRLLRASATTTRYCGLRILPSRFNWIWLPLRMSLLLSWRPRLACGDIPGGTAKSMVPGERAGTLPLVCQIPRTRPTPRLHRRWLTAEQLAEPRRAVDRR